MSDPLHRAEPRAGTLSAVVAPPPAPPATWPGRILRAAGLVGMVLALALAGMNLKAQGELRLALAEAAAQHARWQALQAWPSETLPRAVHDSLRAQAAEARRALEAGLADAALARVGLDTLDRSGLRELQALAAALDGAPPAPEAAAAPEPPAASAVPPADTAAPQAPASAAVLAAASEALPVAASEPSPGLAAAPAADPPPAASEARAADPPARAVLAPSAFAQRLALEQARAERRAWGAPEPMVALALALLLWVMGSLAQASPSSRAVPAPAAPAVPAPPPFDAPLRAAARGVLEAHAGREHHDRLRHAQDDALLVQAREACEALLGHLALAEQKAREPAPTLAAQSRLRLAFDGLAELSTAVEDSAGRLRDRAVAAAHPALGEHEGLLASTRALSALLPRLQAAVDACGPAGAGLAGAELRDMLALAHRRARELQDQLTGGPSHAELVARDELQARVAMLRLALEQAEPGRKDGDGPAL